jgi:hypothetical protein
VAGPGCGYLGYAGFGGIKTPVFTGLWPWYKSKPWFLPDEPQRAKGVAGGIPVLYLTIIRVKPVILGFDNHQRK